MVVVLLSKKLSIGSNEPTVNTKCDKQKNS